MKIFKDVKRMGKATLKAVKKISTSAYDKIKRVIKSLWARVGFGDIWDFIKWVSSKIPWNVLWQWISENWHNLL